MTAMAGFPDPATDPQFYDGVRLRRLAAFAVDLLAILILLGGVAVIGVLIGLLTLGVGFLFLVPAFALTGIVYRATMLMDRSATLGMALMGIEVRDRDGEPLDSATAVIHTVAFTAMSLLIPVLIASVIYACLNARGQTLHDALVQTVVINRPL
ncbi:MAG: RDD family protein [Pseudomonadota bacterium]